MAERFSFDAVAVQLGVAYGLLAGTAAGLLTGNLGYWMTLGTLSGGAIACGFNDAPSDHHPYVNHDPYDEE